MLESYDILRAVQFAETFHRGQVRKYTGAPYLTHCLSVASKISITPLHGILAANRGTLICAALLHDVVEDTPVTVEEIKEQFGEGVSLYVKALTDDPAVPGGPNRAARKARTRARLGACGDGVKIIKCADILDNMSSIMDNDPDFAKVFIREVGELIPVLKPTCQSNLYDELVTEHMRYDEESDLTQTGEVK